MYIKKIEWWLKIESSHLIFFYVDEKNNFRKKDL